MSVGLKVGIILNGSPLIDQATYLKMLEEFLKDKFADKCGITEVDGEVVHAGEKGKLYGLFDILGHIGDIFIRRFTTGDSDLFNLYYGVLN